MECERVREEFIERLTGTLDADRASAIDQHLAGCPACRAETERLTEMWKELGQLRIPAPTGAGGRIERLIDARAQSGSPTPSREGHALRFTLIGSLAVAASLAIGILIGQRSATPLPMLTTSPSTPTASNASASAPKPRYLLLLHGPAQTPPQTAEQSVADSIAGAAIVAEYKAWAMRLRDSGALVAAEKLAANPVTMLSASGATEMPRGTADELGGFFLIQADSAEAYRIARECPHLRHGGTVQVRRIQPT
jgi:hypothetical protein